MFESLHFAHANPLTATPTGIIEIKLVTYQQDKIIKICFCSVFWICSSSWLIFNKILKKLYLFSMPIDFLSTLTSSIRREDDLYLHNQDTRMNFRQSSTIKPFCFNVFLLCVHSEIVEVISLDSTHVILLRLFRDFRLCCLLRCAIECLEVDHENDYIQ